MNVLEKISTEAIEIMRKEISDAQGNEVFFRGIPNENGIVSEVEVLARGNKYSVPAILNAMRRKEIIIHNHPSGYLYPSDADIEIASIYASDKQGGSYIINNDITDIYVIVELYNENNIEIDIEPYFSKKGLLSQVFTGFEYRDEQLNMAKTIENGINNEKTVIVEAGTGTGKTLAYLIPAIEWSIKNKKRVVITTNTITLQEQLLTKDIPIAQGVIQGNFSYILVKGRGNYLCNRKYFQQAIGENDSIKEFTDSQKDQFKMILTWGNKTETGDKSELPFEVENSIWELFYSESDMCGGNKCPYRKECFFLKAREEKKKADILITNHHLYFSDLAIRKELGFNSEYSILPEYGMVVFDEAHNVEKVARDYFSYEASKYSFVKTMNKIYPTDTKKREIAAFMQLKKMIEERREEVSGIDIDEEFKAIINKHQTLAISGREYFDNLIQLFTGGEDKVITQRIKKDEYENSPFLSSLTSFREKFNNEYLKYAKQARKFIQSLKDEDFNSIILDDYERTLDRLDGFMNSFNFIHDFEDPDFIYWIEASSKGKIKNSKLVATPLKVDNELKKNLYINLKNLIFTSATIAIGDDFSYFKNSIGLEGETVEKVIHSPFDYDKQMVTYIPKDMADPSSREFIDEVSEFVKAKLIATKGKTFLLFTSYQALNYVYYSIRNELEKAGLTLLVQGSIPRGHLINNFKTGKNPVLFGTDSFWEGIDIKGEQLSNVILIKLPFKVPSDPVTEAIIEYITEQNKNSFTEFQIPEAVIKFKQGIGRLIRGKKDCGTITILDNRIITKKYGKYFIDSIPTKNIKVLTKSEILKDVIIKR